MRRWAYDLSIAIIAGLVVLGVTAGLGVLHGWALWVAAGSVAVVTLVLLVFVARRGKADAMGDDSYEFLHHVRSKDDIEVSDTEVSSDSEQAKHASDLRTRGGVKITGSTFTNKRDGGDRKDG